MTSQPPKRWMLELGLLALPALLTLGAGGVSIVGPYMMWRTLAATFGAAVGGIMLGITSKRFLASKPDTPSLIFGLGAASAIGVLALGFIYIFYMRYAMSSIGTPSRTVSQTAIFVTFLLAAYAGTSSVYAWFSHRWETPHRPTKQVPSTFSKND